MSNENARIIGRLFGHILKEKNKAEGATPQLQTTEQKEAELKSGIIRKIITELGRVSIEEGTVFTKGATILIHPLPDGRQFRITVNTVPQTNHGVAGSIRISDQHEITNDRGKKEWPTSWFVGFRPDGQTTLILDKEAFPEGVNFGLLKELPVVLHPKARFSTQSQLDFEDGPQLHFQSPIEFFTPETLDFIESKLMEVRSHVLRQPLLDDNLSGEPHNG